MVGHSFLNYYSAITFSEQDNENLTAGLQKIAQLKRLDKRYVHSGYAYVVVCMQQVELQHAGSFRRMLTTASILTKLVRQMAWWWSLVPFILCSNRYRFPQWDNRQILWRALQALAQSTNFLCCT